MTPAVPVAIPVVSVPVAIAVVPSRRRRVVRRRIIPVAVVSVSPAVITAIPIAVPVVAPAVVAIMVAIASAVIIPIDLSDLHGLIRVDGCGFESHT
jgi:hypothetical protein